MVAEKHIPSPEPSAAALAMQAAKRAVESAKQAKAGYPLQSDQTQTLLRLMSADDARLLDASLRAHVHIVQALFSQGLARR